MHDGNIITVRVPERGSFNAGIVEFGDWYICVYRPDETRFIGCYLDKHFQPLGNSFFPFETRGCSDPRLVKYKHLTLCTYCALDKHETETQWAKVIHDGGQFIDGGEFRLSPDDGSRQKNWMPFSLNGRLYFIASVSPHMVYEFDAANRVCEDVFQDVWQPNWISNNRLRGNTNAVELDDGSFLGTFHTCERIGNTVYYDTGAYQFEGKPPFKVIRSASLPFLPAECATSEHFRKAGQVRVCFPIGMVRKGEQILISYGDNDSQVKVLRTTVDAMLNPPADEVKQLLNERHAVTTEGHIAVEVLRPFYFGTHNYQPASELNGLWDCTVSLPLRAAKKLAALGNVRILTK